jgi:hypothetical protein
MPVERKICLQSGKEIHLHITQLEGEANLKRWALVTTCQVPQPIL